MQTMVDVVCDECGETFQRTLSDYNKHIKNGCKLTFCSQSCRGKFLSKKIDIVCDECGKSFKRTLSVYNRNIESVNKLSFCSKSCHGKFISKNKKIETICDCCGKKFLMPKWKQNFRKKNGNKLAFCSRECHLKYRSYRKAKDVKSQCACCRKNIVVKIRTYKRSKSGKFFCSASCSNKFYKSRRLDIRKKMPTFICLNCGEVRNKHSRAKDTKFCSRKCLHEYENKKYIEKWKNGEIDGVVGSGVSKTIKNYLRKTYGDKCQKCGWSEIHQTTKKSPLHIHHIDGNWKNNKPENIQLLCPNCHTLDTDYSVCNNQKDNGRPKSPPRYIRKERR